MGGIEASGGILQRRHDLPDAAVDVFKGILFLVILASETYVGKAVEAVQKAAAKHAAESAAQAATERAPAAIEKKSEAST
jgi:simple sugar transport system permease protein